MDLPMMTAPQEVDGDTVVLPTWLPVPGLGVLPANAFLIRAAEPVLVDCGVIGLDEPFVEALAGVLDPADLRWIWLTHTDADHTGALERVLALAPRARLVTTFLGMGKLGMQGRVVPPDRVFLLNPGQRLEAGDRSLLALRPPTFDAPETTALIDGRSRHLFTADAFGGVLPGPVEHAEDLDRSTLRDGIVAWTTVDAPWLHGTMETALADALRGVRALEPSRILSAHLPPAGDLAPLLDAVTAARTAAPFVGPDQAALEAPA